MQELSDRSMRHWNLAGTYRREADRCWWSWYCTGMPGEYDSRITSMGKRRLRLRNCSISRVDYQESLGWRLAGSLKPQGTSRIWTPLIR